MASRMCLEKLKGEFPRVECWKCFTADKCKSHFRREHQDFIRPCGRPGHDAQIEGTYLIYSQFPDVAWETAEQVNLDELESNHSFNAILR